MHLNSNRCSPPICFVFAVLLSLYYIFSMCCSVAANIDVICAAVCHEINHT